MAAVWAAGGPGRGRRRPAGGRIASRTGDQHQLAGRAPGLAQREGSLGLDQRQSPLDADLERAADDRVDDRLQARGGRPAEHAARAERGHEHVEAAGDGLVGDHRVATAGREQAAAGRARVAADGVEHDLVGRERLRLRERVALRVVDDLRGPELAHERGVLAGAHADGAAALRHRELHRHLSDPARGAEDQRALARPEAADLDDAAIRGDAGDRQRGGELEVEARRQHGDLVLADDDRVGLAASLAAREVGSADDLVADLHAVDLRADGVDDAGEVDPEHDRRRRSEHAGREAQRAALAHLPVDRVDADRPHAHAQLVGPRLRQRQLELHQRFALGPAALRHRPHGCGRHARGW
jgi:hypothetical protein